VTTEENIQIIAHGFFRVRGQRGELTMNFGYRYAAFSEYSIRYVQSPYDLDYFRL